MVHRWDGQVRRPTVTRRPQARLPPLRRAPARSTLASSRDGRSSLAQTSVPRIAAHRLGWCLNRSHVPREGVMNAQCFDALTWHLGTASSRRRALIALLAATLGPIFGGSAVNEVAAGCRHGKRRCKKKHKKKKRKECGGSKQCPPETPWR